MIFVSAHGRAPEFMEPYAAAATREEPYAYRGLGSPIAIEGTCDRPGDAANLVLTFETDSEGGLVKSWEVLYESDDKRYATGLDL